MKRWMVLLMGIGLVFSTGAVPPAGGQVVGSFQGLGFLSTIGFGSSAWAVSADGTAVTGFSFVSDWAQAFIWTETTGIRPLPLLPNRDPNGNGYGLSADGLKVAGTCGWEYSGYEACVWTYSETSAWTVIGLGDLAGGKFSSQGYWMNPEGNVVVGSATSDKGTEASRWTLVEGTWVLKGLGDLPKGDYWSEAYSASSDGSVVVGQGSVANNGVRAFRWTAAKGMVDLGVVARKKYSAAWGCSADGSVVVGESFSARGKDEVAFRWTADKGMVALGDLPGGTSYSEADGVSADGSLVVGGSMTAKGVEAFIWDVTNGMRRLADYLADHQVFVPVGWTLTYANSITVNAGVITIVGKGTNLDGYTEAWRAVVYQ
jgi:probable HAF family extracellular repeat protein